LSSIKNRCKRDSHGRLQDEKTSLRVWWRDEAGCERTDFVSFSHFQGIDVSLAGVPVRVFVADVGTRRKVVKITSRENGKMFDVYPYRVGVVVERNDSRHMVSVMHDDGKCFPVNLKKVAPAKNLMPGDLCRIALLEREGMAPLFLDIAANAKCDVLPQFTKEFCGVLLRNRGFRDAHVEDVVVPSGLYSREMVGRQIKGLAAVSNIGKDGNRVWKAVTVSTVSKDLEVRP
jgi:hypothetical protein